MQDATELQVTYQFETIEKDMKTTYPFIRFEYSPDGIKQFSMEMDSDSVFRYIGEKDWMSLVDENKNTVLYFGDSYGSHVDNGTIIIAGIDDIVKFSVDGARGGKIEFCLPKKACRNAFVKLSNARTAVRDNNTHTQ